MLPQLALDFGDLDTFGTAGLAEMAKCLEQAVEEHRQAMILAREDYEAVERQEWIDFFSDLAVNLSATSDMQARYRQGGAGALGGCRPQSWSDYSGGFNAGKVSELASGLSNSRTLFNNTPVNLRNTLIWKAWECLDGVPEAQAVIGVLWDATGGPMS